MAEVVRTHLDELTGRFGIYQHARGRTPDPGHGYCTDDVARAAIVDILHGREIGRAGLADSLGAERRIPGRGRTFRPPAGCAISGTIDGNWLEDAGICRRPRSRRPGARDDRRRGHPGHDRQLGGRIARGPPACPRGPSTASGHGPTWSWAAVPPLRGDEPPAAAAGLLEELAGRLLASFDGADDEWPWPEPVATYENALLAQALIEAGEWLANRRMVEQGLGALEFLLAGQIAPAGYIELVGNQGWWPKGDVPAHFDQQPIDAAALVEACGVAWRVTGERAWLTELERSYAWFGGWNSIGIAVADPSIGGCGDGLSAIGVSANQGAESTLAWLAATEWVRISRAASIGRAEISAEVSPAEIDQPARFDASSSSSISSGRLNPNSAPPVARWRAQIRPPISSTSWRHTNSPMPAPLTRAAVSRER